MNSRGAIPIVDGGRDALVDAVRASYQNYKGAALSVRAPELIRAGVRGGLPFDSLSTDVVRGCLPPGSICFGGCFAASAAFQAGEDFGRRVPNTLDHDVLAADLDNMERSQKFVRNGWNSDPSWAWPTVVEISRLMRTSGRLLVVLTRAFHPPCENQVTELIAQGAELRLSLSAFDAPGVVQRRLDLACAYRSAGGIAIPVVVTANFIADALNKFQDDIVSEINRRDLPGAENSLRFRADSIVAQELRLAEAFVENTCADRWFGRLFAVRLPVPTITSVDDSYGGIASGYQSRIDPDQLSELYCEPVPTYQELATGVVGHRPRRAGVAHRREND